jgi:predicted metalloprotease
VRLECALPPSQPSPARGEGDHTLAATGLAACMGKATPSGRGRGEGRAEPGRVLAVPRLAYADLKTALGDTEDTWQEVFRRAGQTYRPPKLVLFSGAVESACGIAGAAVGPFYCPLDSKVYLDLSFFQELRDRFRAPGDFAQAYVIAHEVGHHVQNLLGISEKVQGLRSRLSPDEANQLSVRLELQADCLAGVWGHHADKARRMLDAEDVEEGLNAASALGDDRIQRRAQGYIVPESFTHGSAAQRARWFRQGFAGGTPERCDAFGTDHP